MLMYTHCTHTPSGPGWSPLAGWWRRGESFASWPSEDHPTTHTHTHTDSNNDTSEAYTQTAVHPSTPHQLQLSLYNVAFQEKSPEINRVTYAIYYSEEGERKHRTLGNLIVNENGMD